MLNPKRVRVADPREIFRAGLGKHALTQFERQIVLNAENSLHAPVHLGMSIAFDVWRSVLVVQL
jgi:hypothetical protein